MGQGHPAGRHQGAVKAVRLLSGGAAHGLVEQVRPAFEAATGCTIDGVFGAVGAMKARLLSGEPADLLVLSRALIDELAHVGHVAAPSVRDIGAVPTAVALRTADTPPALDTAGDLRTALREADEIHFPDPELSTAGVHFAKVMRELGLWEPLADRLRPAPNGATAMSRARRLDERKTHRLHPGDRDPVDAGHRRRRTAAAGLRAGDDLHLRRHRPRRGAARGGVADRPADERRRPRCASTAGFQLIRGLPRLTARRQTWPQPPARREQTWPSSKPNVTGRCS